MARGFQRRESLVEFKARLLASGRWAEFAHKRKAFADELKVSMAEATDIIRQSYELPEAFSAAIPAGHPAARPNGDGQVAGLPGRAFASDRFKNLKSRSFRNIVLWVFDHVAVTDVQPEDAPSSGAWSLLDFVRTSPSNLASFYTSFVAKLITGTKEDERDKAIRDDHRDLDPWFDSWLAAPGSEGATVLSPSPEDAEGERGLADADGGALQKESA